MCSMVDLLWMKNADKELWRVKSFCISGIFPLVMFVLNWTLFRTPLRRLGFLFYSSLYEGEFIIQVFFHLCITLRKILSAGSLTNLTMNRVEQFCLISSCRKRYIKLVLRKIKNAVIVQKSILITSYHVTSSSFYLLLSFDLSLIKPIWDK